MLWDLRGERLSHVQSDTAQLDIALSCVVAWSPTWLCVAMNTRSGGLINAVGLTGESESEQRHSKSGGLRVHDVRLSPSE